jgi:hypothetical protein
MENQPLVKYVLYMTDQHIEINDIILYLDSRKKNFKPAAVFQRSFPAQIVRLPALHDMDSNTLYVGFDKCLEFYEAKSKIKDINNKAILFLRKNPNYSLGDSSKEVDDTL